MKNTILFLFILMIYTARISGNPADTAAREYGDDIVRQAQEAGTTTSAATDAAETIATDAAEAAQNSGVLNVMMGAAIGKSLAGLAFKGADQQRITGAIDIATGGYLIPMCLPCSPKPPPCNWLKCIYAVSAIVNGGASIANSFESDKAGEDLGGDGGNTSGGGIGGCNPLDTNCIRIYCTQNPNHCPRCSNGEICPGGDCSQCSSNTCSSNSNCSGGQVCTNGTCQNPNSPCSTNDDCSGSQTCVNGTCQDTTCSPACTGSQTCENGTCQDTTCSPACTGGQTCQAGTCSCPNGTDWDTNEGQCVDNTNNNSCSHNNPCPDGQHCQAGTCITCTIGTTWDGTKCDDTGGLPDPDEEDPCVPVTGNTCNETVEEICLQLSPQCRISPPDNIPVFYDPEGNPIPHGDLGELGERFGMTPTEIEDAKKEIEMAQRRAMRQAGAKSNSKGKLKGLGTLSSADTATPAESTLTNFKPSLSNGGGGGGGSPANSRNSRKGSSLSRQLQSLLDKKRGGHRASIKKHGYKPVKLGNQDIGTAHDNIFDMMSRGYQSREQSLNTP